MMKNEEKSVVDIARIRLDHVPFVVTNNKRMAVWSDVKEILLWCPSPHCCVVLDTLKLIVGYPTYETMMHPCSQLEQLMFLKHYMFVPHGTLLVDLDSLKEGNKLSKLYHTVKEQHTKPGSHPVLDCTKMLKNFTEKYANTSFKIPLTVASNKMLLPAVRGIQKIVTYEESCASERDHLCSYDSADGNKSDEQAVKGVSSSKMLVPLALLCRLYPGCDMFLDDVVRLYVLGQCCEENLQSVCQCTTEEGIQLTRFLASQYGYDNSWWCMTTCSLMMSWTEFWFGIDKVCGGRREVLSKDVCVVTLNCQVDEVLRDIKSLAKKSNNPAVKQRLLTCTSPTLSPITDITKNIQGQNINSALAVFSLESQNTWVNKEKCRKNSQYSNPDIKSKVDCDSQGFDRIEKTTDKGETKVRQEGSDKEDKNENDKEKADLDNLTTNEGKNKNGKQGNKTKKGRTKSEKNGKNHCDSGLVTRKLRNGTVVNLDAGDSKTTEQNTCSELKKHKTKRKKKNPKEKLEDNVTEKDSFPTDMKSRLRQRNQDGNLTSKEGNTVNANNSASVKTKSNSLKKSGSGDSHDSETKSGETDESICPGAEKSTEKNSLGIHYTKLKIELPMTKVSSYDLAGMNSFKDEGIHVSITPKYTDLQSENIPGEINPEIPLVDKRNVDTVQSIRNRRETLKIHSAKFRDEIPDALKCAPKCSDTKKIQPSNVDETGPVQKNRCKVENKKEIRNEDKGVKSGKLEYLSLTPKQLHLTGPMLRCPSPSKLQNSKFIPYKQVKANVEETFRKNRTEALIHRPRSDPVSVVLEGKPLHKNAMAGSFKREVHGKQEQQKSLDNQTIEPIVYSVSPNANGTLHQEIVNSLQKKTDHSRCSTPSNITQSRQLTAEGKAVKRPNIENDLNSSDFMNERITMWKDEVEQGLNISNSGRLIKSADLVRRRKMCTYRPKSSIYTSQYDQGGISIKTALCALHSRDRASPDMDKQTQVGTVNNDIQNHIEECSFQNASNLKTLWVPKKGMNNGQTEKGKDRVQKDCHYNVQNFGSSSSLMPDIYDEFARKRKPKSLKLEMEKNKPKQVTVPIPTTLNQPILRKQVQPNSVTCKKPNYHTVGYMSSVDSTQRQKVGSQCFNRSGQQTYRYTSTAPTKNTPTSVHLEKSTLVMQTDSMNSRSVPTTDSKISVSSGDQNYDKNDQSCETEGEIPECDIKALPQKVLSNSSIKSDETSISKISDEESLSRQYPLKFTNSDNSSADGDRCPQNRTHITDKMNKTPFTYKDLVVTQARVESNDIVNRIHALTETSSLRTDSQKDNIDTKPQNGTNHKRQNKSEKSFAVIDNTYEAIERYNQAIANCHRLKTVLANNESKLSTRKQQEVETAGHYFSKLNSQLYYKIPDDDRFHPVSGNMLIPKDAQFFLPSALPSNSKCTDTEHIPLGRNDNKTKQFCHETGDKKIDDWVVTKRTPLEEDRENVSELSNAYEEDELSCTTFDSILKASEDYIDKSRILKHIINETKQAIERTEIEDKLEKEAYEVKALVDECKNETVTADTAEKEKYPKVITSFHQPAAESRKTDPKKSFKEIIEQKREEKRKIQQQLSKKKYWNSAHTVKGFDCNPSVENKCDKKTNCLSDRSKESVENKPNKLKNYDKGKNVLRSDRKINSTSITTSQQRPKSCVGLNKGRMTNNLPSNGGNNKRGPPSMKLNARSHTDVNAKKNPGRPGVSERSKYYQNNIKPSTIFPRSMASKNKTSKETDDCTSKILTALRRLSIEKSPKAVKQKGISKHEVRTSKLRSSFAKQKSAVKPVKSSQAYEANAQKKFMTKSVNDLKESDNVSNHEPNDEIIQEEEVICDMNTVSKIPVVISNRDDNGHCHEELKIAEEFEEDCTKGNGHFEDNTLDISEQRHPLELEHVYDEVLGKGSKEETAIVEKEGHGEEVFITLYDSDELGLYTLDPVLFRGSLNLSSDVPQAPEEKYLGMPYIQCTNSNVNCREQRDTHESTNQRKGFEVNSYLSPENDTYITTFKNDHLQSEHFCYDRNISQVQIPTVSTVCIRSQNMNENDINIQSNMANDINMRPNMANDINIGSDMANDINTGPNMENDINIGSNMANDINMGSNMANDINIGSNMANYFKIESNMASIQNQADKQDNFECESNVAYNAALTEVDKNDCAYIAYLADFKGNCQGHENFTIEAHDFSNNIAENTDIDTDKLMATSLSNVLWVKEEADQNLSAYETEFCQFDKHPYVLENIEKFPDAYFCQPVVFESVLAQNFTQGISDNHTNTCLDAEARGADAHSVETLKASDFENNMYQDVNLVDDCSKETFPGELPSIGVNYDNVDNEVFLDETECGREVYVGNIDDTGSQDLENGILISESEIVRKCSQDINDDKDGNFQQERYNNTEDNRKDVIQNLQIETDSGERIEDEKPKSSIKARQRKRKIAKKKLVKKERVNSGQLATDNSPSQSQKDAYFQKVSEKTGIVDKDNDNDDVDMSSKSDDSLPEFTKDYSIKKKTSNKKEVMNTNSIPSPTNDIDNVKLKTNNDIANENDETDDDDDDGGGADSDDEYSSNDGDADYNPDVDMDEFHAFTDYSDSDSDTSERKSHGRSIHKSTNHKKNMKSCPNVKKNSDNIPSRKYCKVSLERIRTKFQKQYNVKNSSTIRNWKKKPCKKSERQHKIFNDEFSNRKQSKNHEQAKSIVREFCLKQSKNNEIDSVLKRNSKGEKESQLESEMVKRTKDSAVNGNSEIISNSYSDISSNTSEENLIRKKGRSAGMKQRNDKHCENNHGGKNSKSTRKKKKKVAKDEKLDDNSGEDQRTEKDENSAAEGFIKTQKRYYEILRHSNIGGSCKTETDVSTEQRDAVPGIEELSHVMEAVPVHGERVITKALSEAEKALEGTGSLDDIHKDDEGVIIEDLINHCRYQMIEDEDHVQLGGIAHLKYFSLPFVYINGYKYTPLKDTLTIFTQDCCVSACTIPRSVLQKKKRLIKTFSSWDQVYKLELIKMKKGPSIKTGDTLVKLDTLLAYLPELTQQIIDLHKGTKLKRSQNCDITAYETLKSKFKIN